MSYFSEVFGAHYTKKFDSTSTKNEDYFCSFANILHNNGMFKKKCISFILQNNFAKIQFCFLMFLYLYTIYALIG